MKIEYKPYSENNINFRIESSKALERFKAQQFFILTEVKDGSYKFSRTSRELAIIFMDTLFAWLIAVENYLIRSRGNVFTEKNKSDILDRLEEALAYISMIIKENEEIFDNIESCVILDILSLRHHYVEKFFEKLVGESKIESFVSTVNFLVEAMDNFRFELYEVDYLSNGGKKPFICITDFMLDMFNEFSQCIALDRATEYERIFGVDSFVLKNYSSSPTIASQLHCLRENGIGVKNVI